MSDDLRSPTPSDTDSDLDNRLKTLARVPVPARFEDRVLARVRIPLPAWLRRTSKGVRAMLSGPRGWMILGGFSLATAAAWSVTVAAGVHFGGYLSEGARHAVSEAGVPLWREVGAAGQFQIEVIRSSVLDLFEAMRVSPAVFAMTYGAVAVVSAAGLRILTAEPSRVRDTNHVAH
ncbi:MAG TPA: hypothetical protein VGA37_00280 [Gemmatimonadales bacterium]